MRYRVCGAKSSFLQLDIVNVVVAWLKGIKVCVGEKVHIWAVCVDVNYMVQW